MNRFPRLLFLGSEPPSLNAAGSIYFFRLFQHWPNDCLKVITNCNLARKPLLLNCEYRTLRLPLTRLDRTRFRTTKNSMRAVRLNNLLTGINSIKKCVGDFEPDAIVNLMQDSWMYDAAARFARHIRKPLISVVHDLSHGFEPVHGFLKPLQLQRDREFLQQCELVFSVSTGMQIHIEQSFGLQSEVLLPPKSPNPISQPTEACAKLKVPGRLTLGYAGGLHYGYGEQLLQIAPALRAAGAFVHAYGSKPSGRLSDLEKFDDVFQFHGRLDTPERAWSEILTHCDVVFLPYSNPPREHALQYRTHFPSKLGDMLVLGMPILATGPADASGLRWLEDHPGSAFCVTNPSADAFADALRELRYNHDLRVSLARQSSECGQEFEPQRLAQQFQQSVIKTLEAVSNPNA